MSNPNLHNPHLEGEAFFFEGGPVGVFLSHGFTATAAEVRLFAQELHQLGYSVAAPLLPGHGSAPEQLNQVKWQDWAQAGEQTYQQLAARCPRVFVGGESTGALVALHLAHQHPEICGALLYAPAIKLNLRPIDPLLLRLVAPFKPWLPKGSLDVAEKWQGYPVNPLKGTLQLLQFQQEILRLLPGIRQPLIVFQGRLDTTVHVSAGELILGRAASAIKEHHWLEHSTHVVLLDQELDTITRLSVAFINKALRAGPIPGASGASAE